MGLGSCKNVLFIFRCIKDILTLNLSFNKMLQKYKRIRVQWWLQINAVWHINLKSTCVGAESTAAKQTETIQGRLYLLLGMHRSCPTTRHEGAWGERRYSCYSLSTSALDGVEWSASCPVRALALGEGPPVPTVQEAGWAPELVWTQRLEEKSFRLCQGSNLDWPIVQPFQSNPPIIVTLNLTIKLRISYPIFL
jgi:hypothetical protein